MKKEAVISSYHKVKALTPFAVSLPEVLSFLDDLSSAADHVREQTISKM